MGMLDYNYEEEFLKALHGDKSAFRIVYEKYYPILKKYAYFRISSWDKVEDIAHEVFLDALSGKVNFSSQGPGSLGRFLYMITKRKCSDSIIKPETDIKAPEFFNSRETSTAAPDIQLRQCVNKAAFGVNRIRTMIEVLGSMLDSRTRVRKGSGKKIFLLCAIKKDRERLINAKYSVLHMKSDFPADEEESKFHSENYESHSLCEKVQRYDTLRAFQEREMSPEEHKTIAAHLSGCYFCNEAYAEVRETDDMLSVNLREGVILAIRSPKKHPHIIECIRRTYQDLYKCIILSLLQKGIARYSEMLQKSAEVIDILCQDRTNGIAVGYSGRQVMHGLIRQGCIDLYVGGSREIPDILDDIEQVCGTYICDGRLEISVFGQNILKTRQFRHIRKAYVLDDRVDLVLKNKWDLSILPG